MLKTVMHYVLSIVYGNFDLRCRFVIPFLLAKLHLISISRACCPFANKDFVGAWESNCLLYIFYWQQKGDFLSVFQDEERRLVDNAMGCVYALSFKKPAAAESYFRSAMFCGEQQNNGYASQILHCFFSVFFTHNSM